MLYNSRRKIRRLYQRLRKDSIECIEFGDDTEAEEEEEAEESLRREERLRRWFRGRLRDRRGRGAVEPAHRDDRT